MPSSRDALKESIEVWMDGEQLDDLLDMYISDTLIKKMTDAAWAVLTESRETQRWLQREGLLNGGKKEK